MVNRRPSGRNDNATYLNGKWLAVIETNCGSSLSQKLVDMEIWQIVGGL